MEENLPTLELLESRHSFPCPYTFKVIGAGDIDLEGSVRNCVRTALSLEADPATSVRRTSGGRHQAVTVEPRCPSAQSVLDLYSTLKKLDGVLFLF